MNEQILDSFANAFDYTITEDSPHVLRMNIDMRRFLMSQETFDPHLDTVIKLKSGDERAAHIRFTPKFAAWMHQHGGNHFVGIFGSEDAPPFRFSHGYHKYILARHVKTLAIVFEDLNTAMLAKLTWAV